MTFVMILCQSSMSSRFFIIILFGKFCYLFRLEYLCIKFLSCYVLEMGKKRNRTRNRFRLQGITLCISTAMVLVLLGLVVFSVLIGRNLSSYVKENLVVTMWLDQDMSDTEAQQICKKLRTRPFINNLQYVSKEQALKDGIKDLGADPSEFADGNPFLSSIELTLNANYANSDSLRWISKELKNHPKVNEIAYQKDLVDAVNKNIAKISIV